MKCSQTSWQTAALIVDLIQHSGQTTEDDMAPQIITDWKLYTGLQATWILCLEQVKHVFEQQKFTKHTHRSLALLMPACIHYLFLQQRTKPSARPGAQGLQQALKSSLAYLVYLFQLAYYCSKLACATIYALAFLGRVAS